MSDINVKTNAKKLENKAQDSELANLKKLKEETVTKAKQAQTIKKETKKTETKTNNDDLLDLASSVISSASKSKKKTSGSMPVGIIIGIIIGFLLSNVFGLNGLLTDKVNDGKESVDELIDETFTGYTALDFKNVIIGKAVEHQELIVMEQPLEVETTITKAGLGNLEIFSKVKNINYHGKGQYTVNMSKIDDQHIEVDMDKKIVKVLIPHAILQEVILDVDNIEFEDTEKGLLAFGDMALTAEQQNQIEVSVKKTMSETLNNKEFFDQADEFAKLKTWQIFQPLVSAVSNEFVVEMDFE